MTQQFLDWSGWVCLVGVCFYILSDGQAWGRRSEGGMRAFKLVSIGPWAFVAYCVARAVMGLIILAKLVWARREEFSGFWMFLIQLAVLCFIIGIRVWFDNRQRRSEGLWRGRGVGYPGTS